MPSHSRVSSRGYLGAQDLSQLRAFASLTTRDRFPLEATWHPGNVVWDLLYSAGERLDLRLWSGPDGLVAVAWFQDPGELWLDCLTSHEALIPEILAWAEGYCAGQPPPDGALSVISFVEDARRNAALESLGFSQGEHRSVHFRRDLADDMPPAELPQGFRFRDCMQVESEARAACHRDAWNHLGHIGLPEARSQFSALVYERLRVTEGYDPSLDLLVEGDDGTLVADCLCWLDPESGVGSFEPVGVHVDFRRRGLARAVVIEGLRRLKARGATWGRVGTAAFNHPAIGAYLSCGFELVDRAAEWRRPPA